MDNTPSFRHPYKAPEAQTPTQKRGRKNKPHKPTPATADQLQQLVNKFNPQ